ncbi:MAG: ankyrin repeat domain-containing protein [Planctomycetaceae bacterium]|nr:ankyrin repeat domain-containing protein [Planctomycetaceae bacterium]
MKRNLVFFVFWFFLFSGVVLFSEDIPQKNVAQQKNETENKPNSEDATRKLLYGKNLSLDEVKKLVELGADVKAVNNASGVGTTALHLFTGFGNIEVVRYLVEKGANVNAQNIAGNMPIHFAAEKSDFGMVTFLMSKGADVNAMNKTSKSALLLLIENNKIDKNAIKDFLTKNEINIADAYKGVDSPFHAVKGRSINTAQLDFLLELGVSLNLRNKNGFTPLHVSVTLPNYREYFDYLIDKNVDVNLAADNGKTALHLALSFEHDAIDIVKKLIGKKADVNKKDKNDQSPLLEVLKSQKSPDKKLELVKLLVEQKADVKVADVRLTTPLHAATFSGQNREIISYLLENGADVNAKNSDGQTALMLLMIGYFEAIYRRQETSLQSEYYSVFKDFIKHGADLSIKDKDNLTVINSLVRQEWRVDKEFWNKFIEAGKDIDWSQDKIAAPVCWALSNSANLSVLEYLDKNKADFNKKNQEGKSPLYALIHPLPQKNPRDEVDLNKIQKLKYLVQRGANVNEWFAAEKTTPFFWALQNYETDLDTVKFLVEKGADPNTITRYGGNALHLLLINYHVKSNTKLEQKTFDTIKYLVEKGANVDLPEKGDLLRPIHYAAQNGTYRIVKYLADQKVKLNTKSANGATPLHFAASGGVKIDLIKLLLQNGCSVNDKDNDGRTPFLLAAATKETNLDTLKYLCENENAEVNIKDVHGNTPLLLAVKNTRQIEKIKYLIERGADVKAIDNNGMNMLHCIFGEIYSSVSSPYKNPLLYAGRGEKPEEICDLISFFVELGADINYVNKNGMTPLLHSVSPDCSREYVINAQVISHLIAKGAKTDVKDKDGYPLLHVLMRKTNSNPNNFKPIVELFKIDFAQPENRMVLHDLIKDGWKITGYWLPPLIQCGYSVDSRDGFGSTLLHVAASWNKPDLVRILIENGADVNAKDNNGATPLHDSMEQNGVYVDVMNMLIEAGADVDAKDNFGMTPLDVAYPSRKKINVQEAIEKRKMKIATKSEQEKKDKQISIEQQKMKNKNTEPNWR